jgi:hypothetical protein
MGDPLFCPFECDTCSFYKLHGLPPQPDNPDHKLLLAYIRRANLDAFWSRRPSTVAGLVRGFKEQVDMGDILGLQMFEPMGPFSRQYNSGILAAVGVLMRAQKPGRHEERLKYSSVRAARTVHTNTFGATAMGIEGAMVWRSDKTRFVATKAPTDSAWFVRFMSGFRLRVGERVQQDAAISISLMMLIQTLLEEDWEAAVTTGNLGAQRAIAEHGAFFLFLYCGSLRGFEGPKVLLSELKSQIVSPENAVGRRSVPHVGIPLSGRFKAQVQTQQQILIPVAYTTASGLQPGLWAERAIACLEREGVSTGWLFQGEDGRQMAMSEFEEKIYELLARARDREPGLFPGDVDTLQDYHLGRSFRRGATSRATAAGVAQADIDWHNRWNIGLEQTGSVPMRVLYSDRAQNMDTYLRFSKAL